MLICWGPSVLICIASKVYFNFVLFLFKPVLILIQRMFFNQDFKFTMQESLIILVIVSFNILNNDILFNS